MTVHSGLSFMEDLLARSKGPQAKSVFTVTFDDEARGLAEMFDASRKHGVPSSAFAGIPITVKDNFDVKGQVTTAGSTLLADAEPAGKDAVVVERLRKAGFILLGRTNMTEFAFSGLGINPHWGTPANPAFADAHHIPGGSSSGAAVSVALGLVPAAIGSDTGGSIRIPAALCGLTGFKATASAVSREGMLPLSHTLDSVGVIAGTVAECAALFEVIREQSRTAAVKSHPGRIRLGVVTNYFWEDATEEVVRSTTRAIAALEAGGISIERLSIPIFDRIPEMTKEAHFAPVEAAAWHKRYLDGGRGDEYDQRVVSRIVAGAGMPAHAYARLLQERARLIAETAALMDGLDALVWPTVPFTAPTLESLSTDAAYHKANLLALRNSTVANLLDGCAISLPCPSTDKPVGLTLAALHGSDDQLLAVAAVLESILKGKNHGNHQAT